ncbi:MAG TPA: DNA replication protein [Alphaproteobacteria bacterium]|nr:DNA replication protein [Alphaproteobacteria bacterium]
MTQLAFDLAHRPALGREDFLVAPCNAEAVAWLDRWPDWPAPALTLYGPAGCGKSHLAQVWRARSGAIALGGAALDVGRLPSTLGDAQAAILEDADAQVRDEEALLHLYNMLAERRGHLLLSARTPPARWPLKLADLRSRLVAAPAVAVALPDETLIAALLVKLFADRQLRVSADLVDYLVPRLERSFEAVLTLVAALDAAALEGQRAVTVPLARKVMDGIAEREGKR